MLNKAGLSDKEARVYLALLELGPSSAYKIGPKAALKRPITYVVLESLQHKGLVSSVPQGGRKLYVAVGPGKILGELEKTKELYKRFLPNLEALYNESERKEKPQVQFFEGKEAVAEVYERILQAKKVDFFCTIRDIESVFPDYPNRIMKTALEGKMKFRELLSRNEGDINYAKKMQHSENYQHRFLPAGMNLMTDNALFDGTAAFFSYQPYIFAVQISSRGIYESLEALFITSWLASEPYEKVVN